jgi:hypothetical protein
MRTEDQMLEDYKRFRGKCREFCEAEIVKDPTLTLVRGHYFCPFWGEQAHWWLTRQDGTIFDPTKAQFPSNGAGAYLPFSGTVECASCGKEMREEDAEFESGYAFCSYLCHGRFVGVL